MQKEEQLLERFRTFVSRVGWLDRGERVLLAVSGGVDSVAMTDLFRRAGFSFGIAHVNFRLRGEASDGDAAFVQALAEGFGAPYYYTAFPTEALARERKLAIQVLARDLRYDWLEEVRREERYDWVATAHHLNDSIETALFNWTKGTGLRGLLGIPRQNGRIIRPLLFATRTELEKYVKDRNLPFRTDASNLEDKYSRNKIRQHVWPVLREINPGLEETFRGNLERLEEINVLYEWALDNLRRDWTTQRGDELHIAVEPLRDFPAARTLLFEWLRPYGFSSGQAGEIFASLHNDPGAVFYSATHRVLLDRDALIVSSPPPVAESPSHAISRQDQLLTLPEGKLEMRLREGRPVILTANEQEAMLDLDQLQFPLTLRHWRPGDRFAPLGMEGRHQKLQDFFSNQKLSRFEKEKVWLLVNGDGEIAWVVGMRIADPFKITQKTTAYLQMRFQKT